MEDAISKKVEKWQHIAGLSEKTEAQSMRSACHSAGIR